MKRLGGHEREMEFGRWIIRRRKLGMRIDRIIREHLENPKRCQRGESFFRRAVELTSSGSVLSSPPREIDVVLRFIPRASQLRPYAAVLGNHDDCVGCKKRSDRNTIGVF